MRNEAIGCIACKVAPAIQTGTHFYTEQSIAVAYHCRVCGSRWSLVFETDTDYICSSCGAEQTVNEFTKHLQGVASRDRLVLTLVCAVCAYATLKDDFRSTCVVRHA